MSADIRRIAPGHQGPRQDESPLHAQKGYETLDAQAGATYRAGAYILGTMVVVALVLVPMYWFLARREAQSQPQAATVLTEQPKAAPTAFPKLVTSEPQVLAEFRRQEDELLDSYGWVEKDRGIARMPIADAVRIVGERGALPAFPGSTSPLGTAPGAASRPAPPAGSSGATTRGQSAPAGGAR
jgi:hypothetical protein